MKLLGRVVDGQGHCSQWSDDLLAHYRRLSGLNLVKGTLNVDVGDDWSLPSNARRLCASEWGGQDSVLLARCWVNDYPAVVIRTERNEAGIGPVPKRILEVAANFMLRERLGLRTGDAVRVTIDV